MGVGKIKFRTALSVLDHIVETLPLADGSICQPLQSDYFKCFKVLLDHPPYCEHMRPKQWQYYVDFSIEALGGQIDDHTQTAIDSSHTTTLLSRTGFSQSLRLGDRTPRLDVRKSHQDEEMLMALKNLTATTNAPIMTRAAAIGECIKRYINGTSRAHEAAFETMNNILTVSLTEDVSLSLDLVSSLLPLIRRLWTHKSSALRDQMLILLWSCRHLILTSSNTWSSLDSGNLSNLLETMVSEYTARNDREILHFDDLKPMDQPNESGLPPRHLFPLRGSPRAISNWFGLSVMANLLAATSKNVKHDTGSSSPAGPRKRQKLQTPIDNIRQMAVDGQGQSQLAAIQILYFLLDQPNAPVADITESMQNLLSAHQHEDGNVQTWLYLIFSRIAYTFDTPRQLSKKSWLQIWKSAAKAIITASTTRAACLLLSVIIELEFLSSVTTGSFLENTFFGDNNAGPYHLTDTSLLLMTSSLRGGTFDSVKSFESLSSKIMAWLALKWTLPSSVDRLHNAHMVFHARPEYLYRLLITICGSTDPIPSWEDWSPAQPLWAKILSTSRDSEIQRYFHGLEAPRYKDSAPRTSVSAPIDYLSSTRLHRNVGAFLSRRLKEFRQAWVLIQSERTSNTSPDVVEIMLVGLATWVAVATRFNDVGKELGSSPDWAEAWNSTVGFIAGETDETLASLTNRMASIVLRLHTSLYNSNCSLKLREYGTVIESALSLSRRAIENNLASNKTGADPLEDDEFVSQSTQNSQSAAQALIFRLDLPICHDEVGLLAWHRVKLATASAGLSSQRAFEPAATSTVCDEIMDLDADQLLSARGAVWDLLSLNPGITRSEAARLLRQLATCFLQGENYERCEPALCFCLQVMIGLADYWTSEESDDDLSEVSFDIYDWFLRVLDKSITSPAVMPHLSNLFDTLLRVNPSYGAGDVASPRTGLLQILQTGSMVNKFHLWTKLSHVFQRFVLKEHEEIFQDIVDHLPCDPAAIEGIAVRLHILARLGSQWHTVLRHATYKIYETVANVPTTTSLAQGCVQSICLDLGLHQSTNLFRIFAPQIIYTWLDDNHLANIPFAAFGYESLKALLVDNLSEFVGQLVLRGSSRGSEFAQLVGQTWSDLLLAGFATAEAYALSSETSVPKQERLFDGSEKHLRKQVGSERFLQRLRECLPDIIAQLVISLQDDRAFDKGLEKNSQTLNASMWQDMCSFSKTNIEVPLSQQPSFRARCLPDELHYICARLEIDYSELWSPALSIYVYRCLFSKALPGLGPLHTCGVIRKIRTVVSLAGPVALTGYPLEMLLHNLRPYLTIFECADDTMGIYRYLLQHGRTHLQTRVSFISGLGVSIFASLTGFISSSQDSTTQESHFLATMSTAREFRDFLAEFFDSLSFPNVPSHHLTMYRRILDHARGLSRKGSSDRSTSEGKLLLTLLEDRSDAAPLLTDLHFNLSLEILLSGFSAAKEPMNDIVADDGLAAKVSRPLLSAIRSLKLNPSFNLWAADVIGRGFITSGMNDEFAKGANNSGRSEIDHQIQGASASYTNIIAYLADLLWKPDMIAAELVERTLQSISTSLRPEDEDQIFAPEFDRTWFTDMRFSGLNELFLGNILPPEKNVSKATSAEQQDSENTNSWAAELLGSLASETSKDPVLAFLQPLMDSVPSVADQILPQAVHLILLHADSGQPASRDKISHVFTTELLDRNVKSRGPSQLILKTLLYLRRCPYPGEVNVAKRDTWLDINLNEAAIVATDCHMYHEALLFLELHHSQAQLQAGRSSRKSFVTDVSPPEDTLSLIYANVDDPDLFYGKHEDTDLQSVITKLTHEGASQKSLSFQNALLESRLKLHQSEGQADVARNTAFALSAANMQGISDAVKQYYGGPSLSGETDAPSTSAEDNNWDHFPAEQSTTDSDNFASLFEGIQNSSSRKSLENYLQRSQASCVHKMIHMPIDKTWPGTILTEVAILAESQQASLAVEEGNFDSFWSSMMDRDQHVKHAEFTKLSPLLLGREATLGVLRQDSQLQLSTAMTVSQVLLQEIRTIRQSLDLASDDKASQAQFSLNRAMILSVLGHMAAEVGLKVDVAIQYDLARTLWSHDETSGAINILQSLKDRGDLSDQGILVTKAELLTDLGQKIAEARLEKPDEIIDHYLLPAFQQLHGRNIGTEAGRVFHNFAAFCDMQLQDSDNLDDFTRISKIRDRKLRELNDLERLLKTSEGKLRDQFKMQLAKTKTWFKLDDEEWKRLTKNRETLILQCLENYLLSMKACDDYRNDTLRFLALWLNQADSRTANTSVRKYLNSVPTLKFAPLVNQLSSRLLDTKDDFQQLLMELMFRICSDHPYHSLYQVFSTSKSKAPKSDDLGTSRNAAASKLAELLNKKSPAASIWVAIHNSNIWLHKVAQERLSDKDAKTNAKIPLRKLPSAIKLEQVLTESHAKIPPPTMNISLRADRDYSQISTFHKFEPEISIAGGVSAPKIMTMVAVDGSKYKMLLKGGNDDLRQDAIMEQVFQQVSNLLQDHRATRQRNLGIRTYKVIPLTQNAGIIEFVKDTLPLHEYLLPAHKRYFPKDLKPNECRSRIADAQNKGLTQRLQAYRTVTNNFHPVMRFFFMEHFLDPDEWFYKRLNYSRSTAAVSILGHVLGLGDRHGHNILLDMKSGEVVHIDLGVAFEAGRVLPVPEVVPFRLTRDLVDGMGLTGVEGVFRRCCNFTLEALRHDQEAIMTILDVLRYDPLYTWSISPLRLQRIQEHNEQAADAAAAAASMAVSTMSSVKGAVGEADGVGLLGTAVKRDINEPSEADRALTVVAKKLGKALSVEATVNELIRQATDERNLAVLYCGWAAYA
ncbi:hypothetical protein, variant [Exophiala mesophila]|nr:hypothetical protein, variant [Exophiala mesophila]KIV93243.1 hypothetical protein, variant [Exophiala mesophila]